MPARTNSERIIGASQAYINATKYLFKKFDGIIGTTENKLTGKPKEDFASAVDVIKHALLNSTNTEASDSETPFDLEFLSDFDLKIAAEEVVYKLSGRIKSKNSAYTIERTEFISMIVDTLCKNFNLAMPKKHKSSRAGIFPEINKRLMNSIIRKGWIVRDGKDLIIHKTKRNTLEW